MNIRRLGWLGIVFSVAFFIASSASAQTSPSWTVPVTQRKLPNGLTVVISEDHSAPTFGLCISYGIGFRLEPQGRTGFAHLFEHMMFEGTPDAPKGVFDRVIEGGGGFNNGDTRYDFTEYIESAPVSALDPILWLEADRLKTLDFSQANLDNQRKVVEEEVRVNVLNQPYGSFFWLDLPQKAFDTFPNAHNFYGNFSDLDAATIQDVKSFYEHYYAPNNAALAIVGDFDTADVFAKVEKYFSIDSPRDVPPRPDVREPPQTAERTATEKDNLARVPALAIGYRMPPRHSPDAIVGAVVGELLHNGDASRLYQTLVKTKQVALSVDGGVNWPLGNPFEYNGPTLMASLIVYPNQVKEQDVLAAYDGVIHDLGTNGVPDAELDRIRSKMRSDWYGQLEIPIERASILSHAALLDGNTDMVNEIPADIAKVSSDDIKAFVVKYLVDTNRTIIDRVPAQSAAAPSGTRTGGR
jgi:zinc protease